MNSNKFSEEYLDEAETLKQEFDRAKIAYAVGQMRTVFSKYQSFIGKHDENYDLGGFRGEFERIEGDLRMASTNSKRGKKSFDEAIDALEHDIEALTSIEVQPR